MANVEDSKLDNTCYTNFIMFLAALLNSIAGIMIDLYAPCLTTIAKEFKVSVLRVESTITISIIGYAVGQLFFGILCDWKGRKASIILGLLINFSPRTD